MRGFILAAGFGTRLRPLTDHVPKALVPFAGVPLLEHAVSFLKTSGLSTIGINAHYLPEQISQFTKKKYNELYQVFTETPKVRGTGGALDHARSFLAGDETFLVANADIVTRFNLEKHIAAFEASEDICRLIAWEPAGMGTILYSNRSCRYRGTVHDAVDPTTTSGADFIGIALYRREFLSLVTADDFSIVPLWQRAVNKGMPVSVAVEREGFWRDLGTPGALAQAHFDLLDGTIGVTAAPYCTIDYGRRCAFPSAWTDLGTISSGPYCWIENPEFRLEPYMSNIIVLRDAVFHEETISNDSLYTAWGRIAFDG